MSEAGINLLGSLLHSSESPARRICGQTHIHFYCGRVCEKASGVIDTVYVCVCVCVCCALYKGHMFDRLLDLDHRHVRVADESELANSSFVRVVTDGWNRTKKVDA